MSKGRSASSSSWYVQSLPRPEARLQRDSMNDHLSMYRVLQLIARVGVTGAQLWPATGETVARSGHVSAQSSPASEAAPTRSQS